MNRKPYHGGFSFPASRVGLPVGPNHAIDAELSIIGEAAEVSPIGPVLHLLAPRALGCVDEALVYPVPDETPLQVGVPIVGLPVLLLNQQAVVTQRVVANALIWQGTSSRLYRLKMVDATLRKA